MAYRYAGIDWATEKHDVLVADEDGSEALAGTFVHDEKGLSSLCRTLVRLDVQLVAIERPDGLLVERLLDAGLRVLALHPNKVAAARDRFRVSGGKSDRFDAFVLCELARTDHHRFRILEPDCDQTKAIRALTRAREDLVETRTGVMNQLRAELERFWPGPLCLFSHMDAEILLAFLERYPSPVDAHGFGVARMQAFLARERYSGGQHPTALMAKLRSAPRGRVGEHELAARRQLVLSYVAMIRTLNAQIKDLERDIRTRMRAHPDGRIFLSLFRSPASVITAAELLAELGEPGARITPDDLISPLDKLRRIHLANLAGRTGRAVITYYSGFQEHPEAPPRVLQVNSADMAGFMEVCSDAPEDKLDLFLHSPGGDGEGAEQICAYLRTQFKQIRAIVPVYAMSAATMMALSADEILMGAHSQIGPIDPQLTISTPAGPRSASAQAIKDQFNMALTECQDPKNLAAWTPILKDYSPGLLATCDHAAMRAKQIVATALEKYMLAGAEDPAKSAGEAAEWFGNAAEFLSHGRPVRRDEAREHGIIVNDLEDDHELQDLVLSVHHTAMLTLSKTGATKLVENHRGRAWVNQVQQVQQMIAIPGPARPPALGGPAGPVPVAPGGPKKPPPASPRKRNRKR